VAAGLVERRPEESDRRAVVLTLSPQGAAREREVRAVEERMYSTLEGAGAPDELAAAMSILERFVAGQPSGDALEAREARERHP
jgi:DNA-binding MarR family transcriptional regulator